LFQWAWFWVLVLARRAAISRQPKLAIRLKRRTRFLFNRSLVMAPARQRSRYSRQRRLALWVQRRPARFLSRIR
jgi:hypothetical protein